MKANTFGGFKTPQDRVRTLQTLIGKAVLELHDMIDGGEECRGMDSSISKIIRILEGEEK